MTRAQDVIYGLLRDKGWLETPIGRLVSQSLGHTTDWHGKVMAFHRIYQAPVGERVLKPKDMPAERLMMRLGLIHEEVTELYEAVEKNDAVETADALADIIYVCIGLAIELGIPLRDVFNEVHAANMTKLSEHGIPILREDGKILKGPHYHAPNVKEVLTRWGYRTDEEA